MNGRTKFRLVCFDLDGTIIDKTKSIWPLIAEKLDIDMGLREKGNKKFYEKLITYDEWVDNDISLWKKKKVNKQKLVNIIRELKLMDGARETLHELIIKGYKLAVISDSIDIVLEVLLPDYEDIFDEIFVNRLFFDEKGDIKGWEATKFGMENKADGLRKIAENEGIKLEECVFVGDEFNDLQAAELAGFSIAFNSDSEELKRICDVSVEKKDLREILKYI